MGGLAERRRAHTTGGATMDANEEQPAPPRVVGDWLEYAPDQWARASAVVALEAITGAAEAEEGSRAYLSFVTLVASEMSGRETRRRSTYSVGALVAALATAASAGAPAPPPPSAQLRPGQRAPAA
jgi:hypothetical protein